MNLQRLLDGLKGPYWCEYPDQFAPYIGTYAPTERERHFILDQASKALSTGNAILATNFIYAGLVLDDPEFLEKTQKAGILRISRFSFAYEPLNAAITKLSSASPNLPSHAVEYLQSLKNLYEVAKSVRAEYEELRQLLESQREVAVKSCLCALDFLFMQQSDGFGLGAKHKTSRDPDFFTVEELAAGFSSLLAAYGNEFGTLRGNAPLAVESSKAGYYSGVLLSAAHFAAFREWEFRIDRLGYILTKDTTTHTFRLSPPCDELDRAIELGFIQNFQQRAIRANEFATLQERSHSFTEVGEVVAKKLEELGHIKLFEKPLRRYVFEYPEPILCKLLKVGEFFLEEQAALLVMSHDLLTTPEELLDFVVCDDLTLHDLLLVARLFQILRAIMTKVLTPVIEKDIGLVLSSLVPAMKREVLVRILALAIEERKVDAVINLFSTDMTQHVDVQYQPLIPAGDGFLLPTNVITNSNFYRNQLVAKRRRLYEDGSIEPLGDSLCKIFAAAGCEAIADIRYAHGQIDVLVLKDGMLFAIECKNSILPTDVHELMTSVDYIEKASDQLTRFVEFFKDDHARSQIRTNTGFAIDGETQLVTGIVMSNRMLMGLSVDGHPVRGSYELMHFVEEGTHSMGDEKRCFWLGKTLCGEDLRRFFEDAITYQPLWRSMHKIDSTYICKDCVVKVELFSLDMFALAGEHGFENAKATMLKHAKESGEEYMGPAFMLRRSEAPESR